MIAKLRDWFQGHGISYWYDFSKEDEIAVKYPSFQVRLMFAWYDLWIGVFVDRKARQVYVFPLPMIGFQIGYQPGKRIRAS